MEPCLLRQRKWIRRRMVDRRRCGLRSLVPRRCRATSNGYGLIDSFLDFFGAMIYPHISNYIARARLFQELNSLQTASCLNCRIPQGSKQIRSMLHIPLDYRFQSHVDTMLIFQSRLIVHGGALYLPWWDFELSVFCLVNADSGKS